MYESSLFTFLGYSETLMCSIEGAIAPVTVTWSLNNVSRENQTFAGKLDTVIASYTFTISEDLNEVMCSCKGPYIVDTYSKIAVHTLSERGKFNLTHLIV